jgi:hypothetical protein
MRELWRGCLAAFGILLSAAHGAEPAALRPLQFLLGEWEAIPSGKPGDAAGGFNFAPSLQDRVIVRTNHADYPASAGKPASRHDDLMVIYADGESVKADYYDSEGHVIRYAVQTRGGAEAVFTSEVSPATPRYRLTYTSAADGTLQGKFEIARPGSEAFTPYLSWSARRVRSNR